MNTKNLVQLNAKLSKLIQLDSDPDENRRIGNGVVYGAAGAGALGTAALYGQGKRYLNGADAVSGVKPSFGQTMGAGIQQTKADLAKASQIGTGVKNAVTGAVGDYNSARTARAGLGWTKPGAGIVDSAKQAGTGLLAKLKALAGVKLESVAHNIVELDAKVSKMITFAGNEEEDDRKNSEVPTATLTAAGSLTGAAATLAAHTKRGKKAISKVKRAAGAVKTGVKSGNIKTGLRVAGRILKHG